MKGLLTLLLLAAPALRAESIAGTIDDPGLRRKTELVYVETVPGKFAPPAASARMDQTGNKYAPHLLAIVAGQKVVFESHDPELHNVSARENKQQLFNQAVLPHQQFERIFAQVGIAHLSCNVHKEMSADVVVLQNPYFARPDPKTGAFLLEGLPAGTYTLRIFGEQLSDEQKARKFQVATSATPVKLASN